MLYESSGTNTNHDDSCASTAVTLDFAWLCHWSQPNCDEDTLYFKNRQVIFYRLQPKHVMLRKRNSQIVMSLSNYQQIEITLTTELCRCCCSLLKSFVDSRHYWHSHRKNHGLICNPIHSFENPNGAHDQTRGGRMHGTYRCGFGVRGSSNESGGPAVTTATNTCLYSQHLF